MPPYKIPPLPVASSVRELPFAPEMREFYDKQLEAAAGGMGLRMFQDYINLGPERTPKKLADWYKYLKSQSDTPDLIPPSDEEVIRNIMEEHQWRARIAERNLDDEQLAKRTDLASPLLAKRNRMEMAWEAEKIIKDMLSYIREDLAEFRTFPLREKLKHLPVLVQAMKITSHELRLDFGEATSHTQLTIDKLVTGVADAFGIPDEARPAVAAAIIQQIEEKTTDGI